MPEERVPVKGVFSLVGFLVCAADCDRVRSWGDPGLLRLRSAGTCTASAVGSTLECAWPCPRHAPVGSGGGMVLFGLGRGWAQSHESATPAVGGHADLELAVTRPRPPVTWPRAERGSGSRRRVTRSRPT